MPVTYGFAPQFRDGKALTQIQKHHFEENEKQIFWVIFVSFFFFIPWYADSQREKQVN